MADITFRDEQLEAWFRDTYTAANASAENADAYNKAQDKAGFMREKIAAERKTRLIEYMTNLQIEGGRPETTIAEVEAIINRRIQADIQRASEARGHPVTEEQIVSEYAQSEIRRCDGENGRIRSLYSDKNEANLDALKIDTLHDMKVVSDKDIEDLKKTEDSMKQQKAIELLDKKLSQLSDDDLKKMESLLTDKMLDNDALFASIPPSMLAKKYNELSGTIEATANDPQAHAKALAQKEKIARRMDELTEMLVRDGHTNDDLYFADPTNIADIHQGYSLMFEARGKDLLAEQQKNPQAAPDPRLARLEQAQKLLDGKLEEYEQVYNLSDIKPENANDLDKRFDELNKKLNKTQVNEETLALVSNFKFLDEQGHPKPQFIDKDGKKSDVYTPGAKIIEGSELETAIQLAKQKATLANLGTKDELKPEFLQQQLSNNLIGTLYSVHITDQTSKGVLEKKDQFVNPQYLEQFKRDLGNPQKPMAVTPKVFDASVDRIVNETGGYATALNNRLKKDSNSPTPPVVLKLFDPLANIDKRAKDRTKSDANKIKFRAEMRKRLLKSGVSAFAVSTGITVLSAGTNKIVGAAAGLGLGLALTAYQLRKHYKQCKRDGKKFKLTRNLALTLGTTALAGFAIGAMATGNPEIAMISGLGALALGTTNGGIQIAKQAKEAHLSKGETAAWIVAQVAVNAGAAFAGRLAGGAIVDAVNTHTNSNIFKHEVPGTKIETKTTQEFEKGTHEASLKTLRTMYTDEHHRFHQAELQAKIDDNLKFIDDHRQIFEDRGFQLNDPVQKLALAEKMELTKIALGENTGIDTIQHVDGGGIHHSHGNHFTMTDKVLAADGFRDPAAARSDFMNMFSSNDPAAINKGLESFEKINIDILGKHNEINYSDAQTMSISHHDGVLHRDAIHGADGKLHVDWNKGTEFNTYVEGPGTLHSSTTDTTIDTIEYVPNDVHPGYGMFGVLGNEFERKRKEPAGAMADKIQEARRKIDPNPHPVDPTPNPQPVIPQPLENLAIFEYQILRGKDPQTTDDASNPNKHKAYQDWQAYCAQVEKERKTAERVENKGDLTMEAFLGRRRRKFEENFEHVKNSRIGTNKQTKAQRDAMYQDFPNHKDKPYESLFCQGLYESIDKSNLSDNENRKKGRTPFTSFEQITHYAGEFARDSWFVKIGTRDVSRMTDQEKTDAQQKLKDDYSASTRINVGSLDEFYSGEVKTSTEYTHQQLELASERNKSWRVIVGKAWDKLTEIAGKVKRHQQPTRQQQNVHQ